MSDEMLTLRDAANRSHIAPAASPSRQSRLRVETFVLMKVSGMENATFRGTF